MDAFFLAVRRDLPLYAVILAYTAACGLLSFALGAGDKFLPFIYITRWLVLLILLAIIHLIWSAFAAWRSPKPFRQFSADITEKTPLFSAGALFCLALAILHGTYTSTKSIAPDLLPFRYDVLLADLDHAIHGADAWTLLVWMNPITDAIQPLYSVVWLFVVVLVTTLAATSSSVRELKAQYAWTFILCWALLGNLLSTLTLAAGPAYYAKVEGSNRFAELMDYLAQHDGPFSAYRLQNLLWTSYADQSAGFASGISAFPSMHVSMVTLFTLYGFRISRLLGFAFAAYALLILLASVHLGWHYAIDGYFSILATLALWKAVAWGLAGFQRPVPRRPQAAVPC